MVTSVEETVGVPPPQELAHDVSTEETLENEPKHEPDRKGSLKIIYSLPNVVPFPVSDGSGPSSQLSPTAQIGGFLSDFASAVGTTVSVRAVCQTILYVLVSQIMACITVPMTCNITCIQYL